ncbi:MAG: histidine kinase [Bacteroidia bacterium]|nr:histidine kinase [Bacteroidia bacterium]
MLDLLLQMRETSRHYNDRKVRFIGVPVFSLVFGCIIYLVSQQQNPRYILYYFLSSVLYTFLYWEGNRLISIYFRIKYPELRQVGTRVLWQSLSIVAYCVLVAWLGRPTCYLLLDQLGLASGIFVSFQANLVVGIGITALVVAIYESVYFLERWKLSVLEAEHLKMVQLQTELESLRNQVNPHFLFNNLNTLASIIPQDPDRAVTFVSQLARVYRYVLEINTQTLVGLEQELVFLDAYLFLLKTRHGDRLQVDISVDAAGRHTQIIPLALQLLVENAVKHNIVSARRPLRIRIYNQGNTLAVENTLQRRPHAVASTGLGLNNIRSRYLLMAGLTISVEEDATHFRVVLPLLPAPVPQSAEVSAYES